MLYTDVWASMGQDNQTESRSLVFQPYRLDEKAVEAAGDDVIVMHCLPAHRDLEIAGSVLDGPQSVVFDQAENRLHAQKALLSFLLESFLLEDHDRAAGDRPGDAARHPLPAALTGKVTP